ncbi:unnamed protein product [Acanthoscelides obtectus]|uniref:Peptidase M10 metallopeptidase domain-containing protein n=1 Tax=Acanthoscelides obtectus TaxID=200917 RepID=A0A9P0VQ07_ACAOB|nr:unnamed protein product [Acanthoscelides obtectus]CAK1641283.1 Putative metalloproteinase 165R [Acanthoscelides obtectus]
MGNDECPLTLDDAGGVLGHAYFPDSSGTCREIHLDINERWYFGNNPYIPKNQTSFLMVLVHEIGHALGIAHSASPNAIMFAFYQHEIRGLDVDDINAVQYLYGRKNKYDSIPKSTTASAIPKTTTTIRSTTRCPQKSIDYTPAACAEEETITEEASGSSGPVLKATTMKAGPTLECVALPSGESELHSDLEEETGNIIGLVVSSSV